MSGFDPQAAMKRCEAATPPPWEKHQEGSKRICWPHPEDPKGCRIVAEAEILGVPFGEADHNADFIAHARSDLPAALEALEEAQEENKQLRMEMGHWVQAYSPDIVVYPSAEAVRAVNKTPEFIVGRNAMMQAIHEGLLHILSKKGNE